MKNNDKGGKPWISNGIEELFHKLNNKEPFDVLIIGSGYGGAIAAAELAGCKDGNDELSICLLERGNEYLPGMFPSRMADLPGHIRFTTPGATKPRGINDGLFDINIGSDVSTIVANGLGGGSLINAGVMIKPDKTVFDERWPKNLRNEGKKLDKYYIKAKRLLGASDTEDQDNNVNLHNYGAPQKFQSLKNLTRNSEYSEKCFSPAAITVAMSDKNNAENVALNKCIYCGDCATGCNHNAKESLDTNLLVKAEKNGAEIYTGATVLSLEKTDQNLWHVKVVYTNTQLRKRQGEPKVIKSKRVILAAGTLGSSEILLRSKNNNLEFSAMLGRNFSTNGDMIAAAYKQNQKVNAVADENVKPSERKVGPTITGIIDLRTKKNSGNLLIQEMAVPGPLRWSFEEIINTSYTLHSLNEKDTEVHRNGPNIKDPLAINSSHIENTSIFAVMGDDDAQGTLSLSSKADPVIDGAIRIKWKSLSNHNLFEKQIKTLRSLTKSSQTNGKIIPNPLWKLLPDNISKLTDTPKGPLLTVHPLGGCSMSDDSRYGVVNEYGLVFNSEAGSSVYDSLAVLDGSIIPRALGANPALSIAAVSLYAIEHLRDNVWKFTRNNESENDTKNTLNRPTYRDTSNPKSPHPTKIQVVERMSGEIDFSNAIKSKQEIKKIVELTLYFDTKSIKQFTHRTQDSNPEDLVLTLKKHSNNKDYKSYIRIFNKEDYISLKKKHLDKKTFKAELKKITEFEATLSGNLELFNSIEKCNSIQKVKTAFAWLLNRGLRDIWVTFFPKQYEKKTSQKTCTQHIKALPKTLLNILYKPILLFQVLNSIFTKANKLRTLEYNLKVENIKYSQGELGKLLKNNILEKQNLVCGSKQIAYTHRANPLRQLTEMSLTQISGFTPDKSNTLKLDLNFLARINIPLLRIVQQQDQPTALAELASLGTYLLRVLINIHILSFRKPDTPVPREIDRLPAKSVNLPTPEEYVIPTGIIENSKHPDFSNGTTINIKLTRFARPQSDKAPIIMFHGYSASGTTYAHPAVNPNLASYMWNKGRDVWIVDLRSSSGMPTANYPWKFEDVALKDVPEAIKAVYKKTGNKSADIFAHCMGSVMFSMALLSNELQEKWIKRIVLSQVGPVVKLTPINILRGYLASYIIHFFPTANYQFRVQGSPTLFDQTLDRILAILPYPEEEFDIENPYKTPCKRTPFVRTRHRMDALYGRDFSIKNIDYSVLEYIDDLFGPLSVETVTQVMHFAQWQTITNRQGQNIFVSREKLNKYWKFPTYYIHGEENGLSHVSTIKRMEELFYDANCKLITKPLPGFGHQDSLIGRNAREVFSEVNSFFDMSPESIEEELAARKKEIQYKFDTGYVAMLPWLGPKIEHWRPSSLNEDNFILPLKIWGKPNMHTPLMSAVVAVKKVNNKLHLIEDDSGFPIIPHLDFVADKEEYRCEINCKSDSLKNIEDIDGLLVLLTYDQSPTLNAETFSTGAKVFMDVLNNKGKTLSSLLSLDTLPNEFFRITSNDIPGLPGIGNKSQNDIRAILEKVFYSIHQSYYAIEYLLEKSTYSELESGLIDIKPPTKAEYSNLKTKYDLTFVLASCQYPNGIFDAKVAYKSYKNIYKELNEETNNNKIDFLILAGDQVYVDATAGLFDPKDKYERFTKPYQRLMNSSPVKSVFRKLPVYTILDDHEIEDNWSPVSTNFSEQNNNSCLPYSKNLTLLDEGRKAFLKYMRGPSNEPNCKRLWYKIERNGFPFFMMDTRTERKMRSSETIESDTIIEKPQMEDLKCWLIDHKSKSIPLFIVSSSIFLPRHFVVANYEHPTSALRSDSWDGYRKSLYEILSYIARNEINNVVFLSGDEHISSAEKITIEVNGSQTLIHSIHSSALYAPYPFANSISEDLTHKDDFEFELDGVKHKCSVKRLVVAEGDGFATLSIRKEKEKWALGCKFNRDQELNIDPQPLSISLDGK